MRRTRIEHMSAGLFPKADIARRGWHGRKVPIAVFATVRRTGVTEHWTGSLGLDVRRPNYLHPLFGILGDQLAKLGGRAGKHGSSKFDESCLDFGIGEPGVDFLIELVDESRGVLLGTPTPNQVLAS